MNDTPILILAAGQSSRMRGVDKLSLLVGDEPLLVRIARIARAVSSRVFVALPVVAHPYYPGRAGMVAGAGVTPLPLADAAEGLSGSLRAGVAALPECRHFMVLLADLPELQASDIAAVLAGPVAHSGALIWRGATADGRPGHPILFDASLRPRFASLAGDGGGEAIVKPHADRTALITLPGNRARLDLDTPEDWAAWRATRA